MLNYINKKIKNTVINNSILDIINNKTKYLKNIITDKINIENDINEKNKYIIELEDNIVKIKMNQLINEIKIKKFTLHISQIKDEIKILLQKKNRLNKEIKEKFVEIKRIISDI
jgi:hypothetical protein